MTASKGERHRVLCALLALDRPLEDLVRELAALGWDSDAEQMTLEPRHLIGILNRFRAGTLNAEEVERWANAIESREDIRNAPGSGELLKAVIFDLANPALQGALTLAIAERLIARLRMVASD